MKNLCSFFAILLVIGSLPGCVGVHAEKTEVAAPPSQVRQTDADDSELAALTTEVQTLRRELRAMRVELRKVLTEVTALKNDGTGSRPTTAARPTRPVDTTVYNVSLEDSPVLGPTNAPVTIVEFSDFQCPYCIREYPKIKQMREEFPDDVKVVFKHYPLRMHPKAKPCHAVGELAFRQQGSAGFWKIHDMIMANPRDVSVDHLREYAGELSLDIDTFDRVLGDEANIDELLKRDAEQASQCHVTGTPTILINGLKLTDRSLDGYRQRIKQILADAGKS